MKELFKNISSGQILLNVFTLVIVAGMLIVNHALAAPDNSLAQQEASISQLSYQGTLLDSSGEPVTGVVDIAFTIYNHPTEESPLWTEGHSGMNAVSIQNGLFNVKLGSLIPIPQNVWDETDLYLGIRVGTDPEMTPRELINLLPPSIATGSLDPSVMMAHSIIIDLFPSYSVTYGASGSTISYRNHQALITTELDPATCQTDEEWCCDSTTTVCLFKDPDGEDILALRMEESHSTACWLVHDDDDKPTSSNDISFATDGGTGAGDAWSPFYPDGNGFFFMREGANDIPIANYATYRIVCFN